MEKNPGSSCKTAASGVFAVIALTLRSPKIELLEIHTYSLQEFSLCSYLYPFIPLDLRV